MDLGFRVERHYEPSHPLDGLSETQVVGGVSLKFANRLCRPQSNSLCVRFTSDGFRHAWSSYSGNLHDLS